MITATAVRLYLRRFEDDGMIDLNSSVKDEAIF